MSFSFAEKYSLGAIRARDQWYTFSAGIFKSNFFDLIRGAFSKCTGISLLDSYWDFPGLRVSIFSKTKDRLFAASSANLFYTISYESVRPILLYIWCKILPWSNTPLLISI